MQRKKVLISSVQSEFAAERQLLFDYLTSDALLVEYEIIRSTPFDNTLETPFEDLSEEQIREFVGVAHRKSAEKLMADMDLKKNAEIETERKTETKICTIDEFLPVLENLRRNNKKIVFTNGVFDIIHKGHISYLQKAKQKGDILILGLNTDASVKRIKGEGRPINDENDRAFVLSAFEFVDYIVLFSEDTPVNLLKTVQPDVLVKGADYKIEEVIGREFAKETVLIDFQEGYSSTNIINKVF